jgi:hypothetical protein
MNEVQFAKKHIRNRFSTILLPHIMDGLWSVYDNAQTVCEKNNSVDGHFFKTGFEYFEQLVVFASAFNLLKIGKKIVHNSEASATTGVILKRFHPSEWGNH